MFVKQSCCKKINNLILGNHTVMSRNRTLVENKELMVITKCKKIKYYK